MVWHHDLFPASLKLAIVLNFALILWLELNVFVKTYQSDLMNVLSTSF